MTDTNIIALGKSPSGNVGLDLAQLLEQRLLIAASSGGGKSGAVFQLCEQVTGKIQIIILDREGEFAPLRAKFPFVLAGPEGETATQVKTATLLAHRLLELGASAIIDLYELPDHQRHEYVRDFLSAMVDAPKTLWHPVIIVVDEAHTFAPEKGEAPSVASQAMLDMATRGRKRGFCLVPATQRLAQLSKTVAANCQNVMIGRTSQIDQARAAEMLHIAGKAERAEFFPKIARMPVGRFYAYGMAFGAGEPTDFQVTRASTLPEKKGQVLAPPPAPASIQKFLPQLSDLPQEAEKKAKTEADLRAELATANRTIRELQKAAPSVDEEVVKVLKEKLEELSGQIGVIEQNVERYKTQLAKAKQIAQSLVATLSEEEADRLATDYLRPLEKEIRQAMPVQRSPRPISQPSAPPADGEPITGPEQRILNALAWMESVGVDEPEQPAVAFLAEYTYGSGGYNNPRGRLRQRGLIEYVSGDKLKLTASGRKAAHYPDIDPTNQGLHTAVLGKLPGPEGRILSVLLKAYPKAVDSTKLAEASGYTPGSGGFNNPRGRLKTLGLVEYPSPGMVVAKDLLFPESV